MRRLSPLLALALGGLVLAACREPAPSAPPTVRDPEVDSALALLTRVSPAMAAESVRLLDSLAYTAVIRLDEFDDADTLVESATRHVRRFPDSTGRVRERLIAADSGRGLPARGAFGAIGLADPVARMLPDEPPYLAPRTQELYRYRLLPPQTIDGRRVVGAEAALRDPGDNEPIRRARSWVDAETGAPFAVEVWRASESVIFDEEGRAGIILMESPQGLVPQRAWAYSMFDVPFGPPRHLKLWMNVGEVGPVRRRAQPAPQPAGADGNAGGSTDSLGAGR